MTSLTQTELLALLRIAKAHSARDWLLILLAFNHGLRASEAVNLRAGDLRFDMLRVQRLKGSLKTIQPLIESLNPLIDERQAVRETIDSLEDSAKLFPMSRFAFRRLFLKYAQLARIPAHKWHPHVLKHTTAMTVIGQGIEFARQYLGHKSISSTGAYLKVSDEGASRAFAQSLGEWE